jgi:hypothetical protein
MEFGKKTGRWRDDASAHSRSPSDQGERMSYWRWLLFVAMARLEVRDDVYWRIPNVKAIRRNVPIEIYPKREFGDPSESIGQGRRVVDCRSAPMRVVYWLRRIARGRPQR